MRSTIRNTLTFSVMSSKQGMLNVCLNISWKILKERNGTFHIMECTILRKEISVLCLTVALSSEDILVTVSFYRVLILPVLC